MFSHKAKSMNWLFGIAGIIGVALAAFFAGQYSQAQKELTLRAEESVALPLTKMESTKELPNGKKLVTKPTAKPGQISEDAITQELAAEGDDNPKIENYAYEQARASVDSLKEAIEQLPESAEKYAKIQSMMQALLSKAQTNSNTLRGVLDAYSESPSSLMGNRLQSILAEIQDPEVESLALDMAQSTEPSKKLAGLDLLGRLGIPSEQTFETASQVIRANDSSPEVMVAAVNALPRLTLPESKHSQVIQDLSSLAQSGNNEGVRSSSLFSLGKWAKDVDDLSVVISTLDNEGSPDARISAAMALKETSIVDPELQNLFVDRMSDSNELWEIRRMSAESLQRFKLSGEDYTAYEAFIEEQGDVALGQ